VDAHHRPNSDWPWPSRSATVFRQLATAVFETGVLRVCLGYADQEIVLGKGLSFPKDAATMIESVRRGENHLDSCSRRRPWGRFSRLRASVKTCRKNRPFFYPKLLTGLVVNRIESTPRD